MGISFQFYTLEAHRSTYIFTVSPETELILFLEQVRSMGSQGYTAGE